MKKKETSKFDPKDINTTAIVNKSKVFRDVTLNLSKVRAAMISILQANAIGVEFNQKERTELFFSLTQLFHNQDTYVHRLLVLLLKQIPVSSHDAIIITHSLSKDITGSESHLQGHAIRCLCNILEASSVLALERFLKLAVVSTHQYTASASICGALKIIEGGRKEAILRWLPEIRQASKSPHRSVRFHSLLLLYALKSDDLYASAQLASSLEDAKSQLEQCVSIAIASQSLKVKNIESLINFIKNCLLTGSSIVKIEACRRCPLEIIENSCEALSSLIGTSTLKSFAALRTIVNSNNISAYKSLLPKILTLMKDSNSSIAAIASICVLRLGDQNHIETTTKKILKNCKKWASSLLQSVAEECCISAGKFKSEKLTDVAVFLLRMSTETKSKFSILRSLLTTEGIPKSQLLPRLSEYLEDWDSVSIARTICDYISSQIKEIENPLNLIPVLFNRINLDVSSVRMAALNTLGSISIYNENYKEKIIPLLKLFINDEDDILREQVLLLLYSLEKNIDISIIYTPFKIIQEDLPKIESPIIKEKKEIGFVPISINTSFEKYGKLLWKTNVIDITERDTEFVVSYFLNVYENYLIFEFICTNTVEDSIYNNIHIFIENLNIIEETTIESISYQQTISMYCVIKRTSPLIFGSFKTLLLYTPEDDNNEDEYDLGLINLNYLTWMKNIKINDFNKLWEQTSLFESVSVFTMSKDKSPSKAAKRIEDEIIGLEKFNEEKNNKKLILRFVTQLIETNQIILILIELGTSKSKGIMCRVSIKTENEELSEILLKSLQF